MHMHGQARIGIWCIHCCRKYLIWRAPFGQYYHNVPVNQIVPCRVMKANGKLERLGNSGIVHLGPRAGGGLLTTKMGTLQPSCHTGLNSANTLPWQTFRLPICKFCKINFFWKKSETFRFQKLAGELMLWNFVDVVVYIVMEELKGVFILFNLNSANADLVPTIFQSFMPLFCLLNQ